MITAIEAGRQKPKKDKPDSELLHKLIDVCEAYGMDEADEVMNLLNEYEYENESAFSVTVQWV
jgi:hypothetical protein